jgi:hypothetical protein
VVGRLRTILFHGHWDLYHPASGLKFICASGQPHAHCGWAGLRTPRSRGLSVLFALGRLTCSMGPYGRWLVMEVEAPGRPAPLDHRAQLLRPPCARPALSKCQFMGPTTYGAGPAPARLPWGVDINCSLHARPPLSSPLLPTIQASTRRKESKV